MWTPASTVRHDDEDGLYARARRERAALAPDAHGGELRGLPAAAPATGADAARRRLRTRHHHRGPRGARRARPRHRAGARRRRAGPHPRRGGRRGRENVDFVVGDVHALDLPDGHLRRRARAPGAPAPGRSGDRAARDAPRVPAGRRGRRPRRGLRGVHLVPRRPRPRPVAGALHRRGPCQRRRAGRRPAPARLGARGRLDRRHRLGVDLVLRRRRDRAQRGAACGPTASPARRSPRS